MNIAGIGIVCARGRGVGSLEQALEQGWVAPATAEVRGLDAGSLPVYAVASETLSDKTVLAKARRADRFTRMSVLAAADAVEDSGLGTALDRAKLGVIVGTALGPHATTFGFLDGILDFGDAAASPTTFSHSVHNAAASYIAMTLDVRGPTMTLTHFNFAFHQALILARTWLAERRCDAVLVGVSDELGAVMQHVCGRLLRPAADGRIKPFAFSATPEAVPGEGSAFFLLTREPAGKAYGRAAGIACGANIPVSGADLRVVPQLCGGPLQVGTAPRLGGASPEFTPLRGAVRGASHVRGALPTPPCVTDASHFQILDACGMAGDETAWRDLLVPGVAAGGYAPLFGSMLTISGFHAAVAALTLKRQRVYAAPVPDNRDGMTICRETTSALLRSVSCMQADCFGRRAVIQFGAT